MSKYSHVKYHANRIKTNGRRVTSSAHVRLIRVVTVTIIQYGKWAAKCRTKQRVTERRRTAASRSSVMLVRPHYGYVDMFDQLAWRLSIVTTHWQTLSKHDRTQPACPHLTNFADRSSDFRLEKYSHGDGNLIFLPQRASMWRKHETAGSHLIGQRISYEWWPASTRL